ncbi:MAG: AEC family transporter [Magnetovibrio sp.]|nr:AEC family transporter [Magnetovibrio sp.]
MDALINVVFPVFAIVGLGYLSGVIKILGPESAQALNRFVYYFALPPLLFMFTATTTVGEIFNGPFIFSYLLGTLITLCIAIGVSRFVFGENLAIVSMFGFGAVFANSAYMGIPLFLTAFGEDGTLPAVVATLASNIILIGAIIAALETTRAKGSSASRVMIEVSTTLIKNPILMAPLVGIVFSLLVWPVPRPLTNFFDLLGASAGPAALFALGLSLVNKPLLGDLAEISWMVVLKLTVQPFFTFIMVYYVFELDPFWAKSAVILAALPSGAMVFVIAQQYNTMVNRAAAGVVASTALSLVSISVLLVVLGLEP